MIDQVVGYVFYLGPWVATALAAGLLLAAFAPWLWNQPQKWVFFAIIAIGFLPSGSDTAGDGSAMRQVTWGSLFAVSGLLLVFQRSTSKTTSVVSLMPVGLFILVGWLCLSITWSPFPLTSSKRALQIIGVLLVSLVATRYSQPHRSTIEHFRPPLALFILLGLASAAITPSMAFDSDHALRAISSHKNTWGQFSLLASIVCLFAWLRNKSSMSTLFLGLIPAMISLALSRSATSILAFLVIGSITAVWLAYSSKGVLGKLALLVFGLLGAIGCHAYLVATGDLPTDALAEAIYRLSGKNSSLSGRAQLWQLMYVEIAKHPWLGEGYGGFWTGLPGAASILSARLNWGPPMQAHSGYIDVLNETGLVGAAMFAAALLCHMTNIVRLMRSPLLRTQGAFHAAILISVLFVNYAESSLLRTTHFWWLVFCMSMLEVHQLIRKLNSATQADLVEISQQVQRKTE